MAGRTGHAVIGLLAFLFAGVALAGPAAAAPPVGLRATINQRPVSGLTQSHPLRLYPDEAIVVTVDVTNNTSHDLQIRSVNINGKVMGLTFFNFETRVDLSVPPGQTGSRTFEVELIDLKGQAEGLLPGRVTLLDAQRHAITSETFAADVRGSIVSVYGGFGVFVLVATILLLGSTLVRLAAGRLPANRWSRAARFGTAGLGLGLTLTFTLSALRWVLPAPADWFGIVALCTIGLFVLGYLTPTPSIYEEPEEDDELPPRLSALP